MNLTSEIKAQLAEQKKDCVFCKIISKEIPSTPLFEDSHILALLDIYPASKGHTLFLLKEHYPLLPYLPAEDFRHLFGLIPQLAKALKKAIVCTGLNLFIANGAVAGQQSPHFLVHLLPRDEGDGFLNFFFKPKVVLPEDKLKKIMQDLSLKMQRHFVSLASNFLEKSSLSADLQEIQKKAFTVYEDQKVLVLLPQKGLVEGHLEIYSKVEGRDLEKLSIEESAYLFSVASFAASVLFESLGVQGTNLILKSGFTDDHPTGKLCVQVLPRRPNDSLTGLMWSPQPARYNLDGIASKIKDQVFNVKYVPEMASVKQMETKSAGTKETKESKAQPLENNEITLAIQRIRGNF